MKECQQIQKLMPINATITRLLLGLTNREVEALLGTMVLTLASSIVKSQNAQFNRATNVGNIKDIAATMEDILDRIRMLAVHLKTVKGSDVTEQLKEWGIN